MDTPSCVGRGVAALLAAALATTVGCAAPPVRQQASMTVFTPLQSLSVARESLDDLVAPIALYPDALLAQILPASTLPLEVVQAARWVKANPGLECLDDQPWDPSVLAVARYPTVIAMMDEKLDWTVRLGEAFLAQQEDVMASVQRLRAQARDVGSLCDTEQQVVIVRDSAICIEPAVTEFIYVPVYTPSVVYVRPSYDCVPSSFVRFSIGYSVGSWLDLGCDWRQRRVCVDRDRWRGGWGHGSAWHDQGWNDRDWRGRDRRDWDNYNGRDRDGRDHRDGRDSRDGRDRPRETSQGGPRGDNAQPPRNDVPDGTAWTPNPKVHRSQVKVERATVNNGPRWNVPARVQDQPKPVASAPMPVREPVAAQPQDARPRQTPRVKPSPSLTPMETQKQPARRVEAPAPSEAPKVTVPAERAPVQRREAVERPRPPAVRAVERQRAAESPAPKRQEAARARRSSPSRRPGPLSRSVIRTRRP